MTYTPIDLLDGAELLRQFAPALATADAHALNTARAVAEAVARAIRPAAEPVIGDREAIE